ncbi:MAG: GNAT family N-acetyltransferase [Janthinobacterium lividum]
MNLDSIPVLRSSRLTLRALGAADYPALLALAHDAEVTRYLHEGAAPSAHDVANRVAGSLRQWELRGYGMMGMDDEEGFVGRLGIFHPQSMDDPLLVYAIARRGWGKGYATEGLGLLLSWVRAACSLKYVICHIDQRNSVSARVAQKFGAIRDGATIRDGTELEIWTLPITT